MKSPSIEHTIQNILNKVQEYINTWLEPKCKYIIGSMIDFSYYYLFFYIFITYFLHNVEFCCLFLLGICPLYTVFTFNFVIFDFLTSDNKERFHSFIQHRHIETCQMNFNLDRLTG